MIDFCLSVCYARGRWRLCRQACIPAEIRSGEFGDAAVIQDYRFERLGEVLVERVIWGMSAPAQRRGEVVVSGPGYVWFRFWVLAYDQVLERYYGAHGQFIGTQIDVCMPPTGDERGWRAKDLLSRHLGDARWSCHIVGRNEHSTRPLNRAS